MARTKKIAVEFAFDDEKLDTLRAQTVKMLAAANQLREDSALVSQTASEFYKQFVTSVYLARGNDAASALKLSEGPVHDLGISVAPSYDLSGLLGKDEGLLNGKRAAATEELTPTGRKKRAKKEFDPNMPKKPMTVFLAFSTHKRAEIRAARLARGEPPLQNSEMANEVAELWSKLPDTEKEPYKVEYQKKLVDYHTRKDAYVKSKATNVAQAAIEAIVETTETPAGEETTGLATEESLPEPEQPLATSSPKKGRKPGPKPKAKKEAKKAKSTAGEDAAAASKAE